MLQTLVSHLASADWPANTEKQRARNATVATDLLHLLEMGQGPAPQILEAALPKIAAAKCLLAGQVRALRRRIPAKPSGDAHGQAPEVIAALAGAARTAAKQHPLFSGPAEGADATVKGGMLNFGISGGCQVGTAVLSAKAWMNAAAVMQDVGARWFFGVACRRPPGADIAKALPSFPFLVEGHASTQFDAVVLMKEPACEEVVSWIPSASKTTRTLWVDVGGAEIWVAMYMPPLGSASEEERWQIARTMWEEFDAQKAIARRRATAGTLLPRFRGCGDLNITSSLRRRFEEAKRARSLWWAAGTGCV
ncbi:unnamed protein product [Polarella glacialis]|uniref:Uncharacterized protein n=1 Tax=Polarella glacialis TaxID=89957 RepID=A0A813JU06_POLGL|nr:unnamed protein product [Polarella glacialis]CAE8684591.1 unnamed protein product [Polarella glacialis]